MRCITIILLLFLSACQTDVTSNSSSTRASVYKLGVIAPLTGPFAEWGQSVLNGALLATEFSEIPIKIIAEDGACNPSQIVRAGNALLTQGIKVIIGPGCGTGMPALATLAKEHNALLLSPGLLNDEIFQNHKNIINISTQHSVETKRLAEHIAGKGLKSFAIVHAANLYGEEHARTLKEFLNEKDIKLKISIRTSLDDRDFKGVVAKLLHKNPEGIYIHQSEFGLGLIVRQLRESGYKGQLFSNYATENTTSLKTANTSLIGLEYTFPMATYNSGTAQQLVLSRYRARFGIEAVATSLFVFDSVIRLTKAIDFCKESNQKCIKQSYLENSFEGVSGEWELLADGRSVRKFGIKKVSKSKYSWVS